jgi:glutamine amidotransferase
VANLHIRYRLCLACVNTSAWSCPNIQSLCKFVETHCLFAHVRAASDGNELVGRVSYENSHPFRCRRYTFQHNGGIPGFNCIKRTLIASLSDCAFQVLEGSTDSEVCFAIFLDCAKAAAVRAGSEHLTAAQLGEAVSATVTRILTLVAAAEAGLGKSDAPSPCSLNFCVTDGRHIVATRYRNHHTQVRGAAYYETHSLSCNSNLYSATASNVTSSSSE